MPDSEEVIRSHTYCAEYSVDRLEEPAAVVQREIARQLADRLVNIGPVERSPDPDGFSTLYRFSIVAMPEGTFRSLVSEMALELARRYSVPQVCSGVEEHLDGAFSYSSYTLGRMQQGSFISALWGPTPTREHADRLSCAVSPGEVPPKAPGLAMGPTVGDFRAAGRE